MLELKKTLVEGDIDHGNIQGLADDDHAQYALLAGRSGGQVLIGSPDTGDNLILKSNSLSDGLIIFGNTETGMIFDEDAQAATIGGGSNQHTVNGSIENALWEFHQDGATGAGGTVYHRHSNTVGLSSDITFLKSAGDHDSPLVVADDHQLGHIRFGGFDGTDYHIGAEIAAFIDGTPGNNDMPARLVFSTTADGAGTSTERATILANGNVGIGTDIPTSPFHLVNGDYIAKIGSSGNTALFRNNGGASIVRVFTDNVDSGALLRLQVENGMVWDLYLDGATDIMHLQSTDVPNISMTTTYTSFNSTNANIDTIFNGNTAEIARFNAGTDSLDFPDNKKIKIGTGKDGEIYYNATNLIIDPNAVGSGKVLIGASGDDVLEAGIVRASQKGMMTSIGGFAIKLTNKTGANSVAGQLVKADTANNDAVILTAANDDECIGVFLNSGVADGVEAWVVVSGIADVAMADNIAATRGSWVATSSEAGYADATSASPAAAPTHFEEIGHCIETVAAGGVGTHILARCVLHFN